jgi:endonuclease/exonuclease/phosphatase family metal-dependent hydrolase
LSNRLRFPHRLRLRELCLLAIVVITTGCGGAYTLGPARQLSLGGGAISWLSPMAARDAGAIARWRAAVGSPLISQASSASTTVPSDRLTIVSWNVALDSGNVVQLVHDIQRDAPDRPIVLLVQEAFRSGDDVPGAVDGEYAGHLGKSRHEREIDDVARELGFSLYYVPSMRNGAPGRHREDRGNAVLSSVPLTDLSAIELPFERQRRVAAAARIAGRTSSGETWSLRLVSVHLDNLAGLRSGWIASEYGRARQARGLREALTGEDPIVLAGDFNTWFGFSDQVYLETADAFPQTRVTDERRTFRGLLRLDHVFYRTPGDWKTEVHRAESNYGSDHYPLITTITF